MSDPVTFTAHACLVLNSGDHIVAGLALHENQRIMVKLPAEVTLDLAGQIEAAYQRHSKPIEQALASPSPLSGPAFRYSGNQQSARRVLTAEAWEAKGQGEGDFPTANRRSA
jgi:hypothetical protein